MDNYNYLSYELYKEKFLSLRQGYIFYNTIENTDWVENLNNEKTDITKDINKVLGNNVSGNYEMINNRIQKELQSISKQEFKNEKSILGKMNPELANKYSKIKYNERSLSELFVDLNKLLGMREEFATWLKMVVSPFERGHTKENKRRGTTGVAYYLVSYFCEEAKKFITEAKFDETTDYQTLANNIKYQSLENAWKRLLTRTDAGEILNKAYGLVDNDKVDQPFFKKMLDFIEKNGLIEYIGLDAKTLKDFNVQKFLSNEAKKTKGFRKQKNEDAIHLKKRAILYAAEQNWRSKQGLLQEVISSTAYDTASQIMGGGVKGGGSRVIKSNIASEDVILTLDFGEESSRQFLEEYSSIGGVTSKKDYRKKADDVMQKYEQMLKNSAIIHISNKNYLFEDETTETITKDGQTEIIKPRLLGSDFSSNKFFKGASNKFDFNARSLLSDKYSTFDMDDAFWWNVYAILWNSISGTIFEQDKTDNKIKDIKNCLKNMMKIIFPQLMFDSWSRFDKSISSNEIFLFDINNFLFPMSFLCYSLSKKLDSAEHKLQSDTKIYFAHGELLYHDKNEDKRAKKLGIIKKEMTPFNNESSELRKNHMLHLWDKQRDEMINKAQIQIDFFNNFREIIKELGSTSGLINS